MFCLLFLLPGIIFPLIFAWLPPFCLVLLLNAPFSEEHTPPFLSVVATKPLLQQTYHISVENFLPHSLRQPFHSYPSIHKHLTLLSFSLILWHCFLFLWETRSNSKETTISSYHKIFHLICFCTPTLPSIYYVWTLSHIQVQLCHHEMISSFRNTV